MTPEVQAIVMAALLAGQTQVAAAQLAGIDKSTVRRALADPEFRAELEEARSDLLRSVIDRISSTALDAVKVLERIMKDPKATWSARVRAASKILDLAMGTPQIEINQTTNVITGGQSPADALRVYLEKLHARAQLAPRNAIETTSTETPS